MMASISKSVKKVDHEDKSSGKAIYIADCHEPEMLYGKMVRSGKARAIILEVELPKLPKGYVAVDWRDVPGINAVHVVEDDMPLFAEKQVEYIGEPVCMIAGPCQEVVEHLCSQVRIRYQVLEPVISMDESHIIFYDKQFEYGDVEQAFAEADFVMEETFCTGYQEHAYLEPQGILAYPSAGGMVIKGSMQCPYYIQGAAAKVLGIEPGKVRVIQSVTGGGFGGKEDYPSVVACEAAVAAWKTGRPVQLVYGRKEDMECTSKRHPSRSTYKAAVKNSRISAMDIQADLNAGAYKTLSLVVLQRTMVCASGAYRVDNLRVRGRAVKTNMVPCGAFRGFGDPQAFFAVEMFMNHIANRLGETPWDFKARNLVVQGNHNSTRGSYHFTVPLPQMMERLDVLCNYREKKAAWGNDTGRYRRGIGLGLHFHGTGFASTKDAGEGIRVKLHKSKEGQVEVLTANTDMGQGLFTTFAKIAGQVLDIPYDDIEVVMPDTERVPDSGPTVASRSILTVGEMVCRAAVRLKEEWKAGEDQTVEETFVSPDYLIPYDADRFFGDPYPAYAWGAAVVELSVDTLTGTIRVLHVCGIFDVGTVLDENIVRGQMEGGMLQGIGYASMEQMKADSQGRIRNNSFSDYIIPTSVDVPSMRVEFYGQACPDGPFGAKGAGELPCGGVPQAYIEALEQALGGTDINHIPISAEEVLEHV